MEETLTKKSKEVKLMSKYKDNNDELLELLQKYDNKVTDLQMEIDILDLKIK